MSLFFSWHFNYETNYYLSSKCVWKEAKGVSSSHLVVTKFYCSVWICFLSNCNFSRSSWLLILRNICHTLFRPFKFFFWGEMSTGSLESYSANVQCPKESSCLPWGYSLTNCLRKLYILWFKQYTLHHGLFDFKGEKLLWLYFFRCL